MLVSRNVTIGALRTSMRLEPEFWTALGDIARIESLSLDALCSRIDARRGDVSRTAAMRLFATAYFAQQRDSGSVTESRTGEPEDFEEPGIRPALRA